MCDEYAMEIFYRVQETDMKEGRDSDVGYFRNDNVYEDDNVKREV